MALLRPWHLLLVAAALFVPLQAGALDSGARGLTVSASLDYCGVGNDGIVCKIDASWSGVEGADRYTSTVTLADGTVRDFGTVGAGAGGGSTSLFVPYAGNGVYSVTVTAWGADPAGKDHKIEDAEAGADVDGRSGIENEPEGSKDSAGDNDGGSGKDAPDQDPPSADDPVGEDSGPPEDEGGAPIDPGDAVTENPGQEGPGAPGAATPDGDEVDGEEPTEPAPEGSPTPGPDGSDAGSPDPAAAVSGAAP